MSLIGSAPENPEYVVATSSLLISNERVLTAGTNISVTSTPPQITVAETGVPADVSFLVTLTADVSLVADVRTPLVAWTSSETQASHNTGELVELTGIFTAPTDGIYHVSWNVSFDAIGAGSHDVNVVHTRPIPLTTERYTSREGWDDHDTSPSGSMFINLQQNDTLNLEAQNNTTTKNALELITQAGTPYKATWWSVRRFRSI